MQKAFAVACMLRLIVFDGWLGSGRRRRHGGKNSGPWAALFRLGRITVSKISVIHVLYFLPI